MSEDTRSITVTCVIEVLQVTESYYIRKAVETKIQISEDTKSEVSDFRRKSTTKLSETKREKAASQLHCYVRGKQDHIAAKCPDRKIIGEVTINSRN